MPSECAASGHRLTSTEVLRDAIKHYMQTKRLSYRAMASRCGVSPGWLFRFLSGNGGVSLEIATKLAKASGGELRLR